MKCYFESIFFLNKNFSSTPEFGTYNFHNCTQTEQFKILISLLKVSHKLILVERGNIVK